VVAAGGGGAQQMTSGRLNASSYKLCRDGEGQADLCTAVLALVASDADQDREDGGWSSYRFTRHLE
jgi:hypothetical protein